MKKFDSRHSTSKAMIVASVSLALGTAMMATATLAFARGGGGRHFGDFGAGHIGGGFGGGRFAGRHFGRGFGDGFGRPHGFGGDGFYYGDGYGYGYGGCYVPTPDGYAWACY
jgi:hypothetical protein